MLYEPKREEVRGEGEKCIMRRFMVYTPLQILFMC